MIDLMGEAAERVYEALANAGFDVSTRQRNLAPSRDHEGRGRPAVDARSRRELREIGQQVEQTVREADNA
jgi:hypothetical protein